MTVLPDNWELVPLGSLLSGSPSYGVNEPSVPRAAGECAYLRITDIGDGGSVDYSGLPGVQAAPSPRYTLSSGDIVVARTGASVGKAHLFPGQPEPVVYAGFLIRLTPNSARVIPEYISQHFQTSNYWDWIRKNSMQSGQPGVNSQQLRSLPVRLPPMAEQEAIAEALSDADALIEALERLIAKKRLIKQGAMQDLLTAKRRLPGFSGEWVGRKLGERGQFFKGAGVRKEEANSGFLPCVRYGELYTLHDDVVRDFASFISEDVAKTARPIKSGDILFAGSGETKGEIGKCAVVTFEGEMFAGGDIIVFRPTADDPVFLSYLLNAPSVQKQKARKGQGDAVVHISATALADLDLLLPREGEQHKISAILGDMDAEIQALEIRLEKARQVKEGMMQNLLTGQIRLV